MTDQVEIQLPRAMVPEGCAFTATAYMRDRATAAASAPSTLKYRLDNLTTGENVLDWTTATAATSVSIAVTATQNAIRDECNKVEKMELTVSANHGLATQVRQSVQYMIANNRAF